MGSGSSKGEGAPPEYVAAGAQPDSTTYVPQFIAQVAPDPQKPNLGDAAPNPFESRAKQRFVGQSPRHF